MEIRNPARERLAAGELSIGMGVRLARTVDIAKGMQVAGYDWLFLDLEHGTLPLDTAAQIAVAALDAGISPIFRVPQGEYSMATRALDNGALGIVIPHVDTADEAREIVDKLKYPPLGHRSFGGTGAQLGFRPGALSRSLGALNEALLTVVMLETPQAIENAREIASVPGIDVLLIGTSDLCMEMGIPGEYGHDRIAEAYDAMIAACREAGKWPGSAGVPDEALIRRYVQAGARFILAGSDFPTLMAAAAQRCKQVRAGL